MQFRSRAGQAALVLLAVFLRDHRVRAGCGPALTRPSRYVTDLAGGLPAGTRGRLNEKLAAFERETSDQLLVYTAARVPDGTTMEELSSRALRDWGVGQKGRLNGVLFFVFTAAPFRARLRFRAPRADNRRWMTQTRPAWLAGARGHRSSLFSSWSF